MSNRKPSAGKKNFAEVILNGADSDARKGYTNEWQPAAQALSLRLWFKDGRRCEGLPWALYSGDDWQSSNSGEPERLTLTFGVRTVTVEGYNLRHLVEQIDEGRLKSIREHDSHEAALLRSGHTKDDEEGEAVIIRIDVEPSLQDFASSIREEA
ncbi:MAG TPA: hypothetical protein VFK06_06755 [Candidatus Angelobacter sp.]|nr:hypothetical protein [Candidatus Angelobacter sp.]